MIGVGFRVPRIPVGVEKRRILILVRRSPSVQGMTIPENGKQASPSLVGTMTWGAKLSNLHRLPH